MMMEGIQETMNRIHTPLTIIDELQQIVAKRTDDLVAGSSAIEGELFKMLLAHKELDLYSIPLASVSPPLDTNSLCRYRGLIQNVPNPEIFSLSCTDYSGKQCNLKYRDIIDDSLAIDAPVNSELAERQPFICVPIPGENAWATREFSVIAGEEVADVAVQSKRPIDEVAAETGRAQKFMRNDSSRVQNEQTPSSCEGTELAPAATTSPPTAFSMVLCYDELDTLLSLRLNDMIEVIGVYSYLPGTTAVGSDDKRGVVSPNSDMICGTNSFSDSVFEDFIDFEGENAKALHCPRIHTLLIRKIGCAYPLSSHVQSPAGLLDWSAAKHCEQAKPILLDFLKTYFENVYHIILANQESALAEELMSTTSEMELSLISASHARSRTKVLQELSYALGGDRRAQLAAKCVMLAILSRLYRRTGMRTPEEIANCKDADDTSMVGSLVLEIAGFDDGNDPRIRALEDCLRRIVPRLVKIDCDLLTLSTCESLLPSRDYEDDSIRMSPLQIGVGTVLLLDETVKSKTMIVEPVENLMSQDNVSSSIKALKSVIQRQILPVKFDYFEVSLPTDCPTILLSSLRSISILKGGANESEKSDESNLSGLSEGGVSIRVKITLSELTGYSAAYPKSYGEDLQLMRSWWAMNRLKYVTMSPTVVDRAENEFVRARNAVESGSNQLSASVTAEDFHRWVTLARLITLSHGQGVISDDYWNEMIELEKCLLLT